MGYEFLRFLEGYIKPEEVNTDAIHMVISLSLGLYFTCLRKTVGKKKKRKCRRSTLNFHSFTV